MGRYTVRGGVLIDGVGIGYRGNDKGVNGLYEALQRDRQGKGAGGGIYRTGARNNDPRIAPKK